MKIKQNIKKAAMLGSLAFGFMFIGTNATVEAATWTPRSVSEIVADLESSKTEGGISSYTVKWGDTLYALSLATDISVDNLAQINDIENARLIEVGMVLYFSEDKAVITIESSDTGEKHSYNVQTGEVVESSDSSQETTQAATQTVVQSTVQTTTQTTAEYSLSEFMYRGVINWGGYKFTYYSQSVLPGGGLNIPGRHVSAGGYVVDGDGYIVLANSSVAKGTIINTPFGAQGKVYDAGTTGNHYDVYIR